jgi:hypothetical protein
MYTRQLRLRTTQAVATADHLDASCPSTNDNPAETTCSINITDALIQLRGASTDEHELQIIYDTITL